MFLHERLAISSWWRKKSGACSRVVERFRIDGFVCSFFSNPLLRRFSRPSLWHWVPAECIFESCSGEKFSAWKGYSIKSWNKLPTATVSFEEQTAVCVAITHPSMPNAWRRQPPKQHRDASPPEKGRGMTLEEFVEKGTMLMGGRTDDGVCILTSCLCAIIQLRCV